MGKITVFLEIFLPACLLDFENFLPTRLLGTARLFNWGHFPTCTFIWATQLLSTREYISSMEINFKPQLDTEFGVSTMISF